MKPNKEKITIKDNIFLIEKMLMDLVFTPRIKALEWSKITKQTPNIKIGYPGQHLASLVVGMEGAKTGARGNDIVDGSEVKSCSRVDQLDTCKDCGEKILRIETVCSNCGSTDIKRMDDSKWLFTIRSENDLKVLTQDVKRIILLVSDYPNFLQNQFDDIRIEVFEIWTKSERNKNFKKYMGDYYHKIYLKQKEKYPDKTPAPKNLFPYGYPFYMCNPTKVFSCIIKDANNAPKIEINFYLEPDADRNSIASELMPITLLENKEVDFIIKNVPEKTIETLIAKEFTLKDYRGAIEKSSVDYKEIKTILPMISEEVRAFLPLRDTNKIRVSKTAYSRKR